jgi:hypothetical protein
VTGPTRTLVGAFALTFLATAGCAKNHGCCHKNAPPPAAPCCPEPAPFAVPPGPIAAPPPAQSFFAQPPSCNMPLP